MTNYEIIESYKKYYQDVLGTEIDKKLKYEYHNDLLNTSSQENSQINIKFWLYYIVIIICLIVFLFSINVGNEVLLCACIIIILAIFITIYIRNKNSKKGSFNNENEDVAVDYFINKDYPVPLMNDLLSGSCGDFDNERKVYCCSADKSLISYEQFKICQKAGYCMNCEKLEDKLYE